MSSIPVPSPNTSRSPTPLPLCARATAISSSPKFTTSYRASRSVMAASRAQLLVREQPFPVPGSGENHTSDHERAPS